MSNLANDVKALHVLISYMWEDAHFEGQDIVELNKEEVATMMDLITRISDQVEDSTTAQGTPEPYVVLYVIADETIVPQVFKCHADSADHALERCSDAYPDADVVWVVQGTDADHALHDYWGFTKNA